jgi:hypothetical protein
VRLSPVSAVWKAWCSMRMKSAGEHAKLYVAEGDMLVNAGVEVKVNAPLARERVNWKFVKGNAQ